MINHISIGVHNPEKVARVLAELWNGYAFPFPVRPGAFTVLADDGKGTLLEITPLNTVLMPGGGLPDENNFTAASDTEEYEAKFIASDFSPKFVATHLNLNMNRGYAVELRINDLRRAMIPVTFLFSTN
jgi:hypothetical protein